jgi:uncharacterized phage protein (TIGR01671 family)
MREILFRGKRADNSEWVEGAYLDQNNMGVFHYDTECQDYDITVYSVLPETVGQYTGLTDKNGVKIFEGDILSAHLDEDNPDYETVVQVIWEEYGWRTMEGNGLSDPLDDEDAEMFAIIGNIHDNPELVEGGEGNG